MVEHSIQLHHFDSCPNWHIADERLQTVLSELGIDVDIDYIKAEDPEEAERVGFKGSPSIIIDGEDPFAGSSPAVGWACRVYQTDAGSDGSPSEAQLKEVLSNVF